MQPAVVRLWRALRPLQSVVTFMNTGAHPDDETSAMLAALGLRDGVRTVFVCSTRGEGGQNALGKESGSDLGALRTREMEMAAEAIDLSVRWLSEGPADTITDFGFSKSAEETFEKWGEEHTIERLVRIIREERPDIICPTFLDVPGQHGHHRAMTRAARRAIDLAADASAFPHQIEEGLSPWQVSKFYLPAWSGAGRSYDDDLPPPNATLTIDTGARDPVLGATYAQIAQWSRAGHATQGMGEWVEAAEESCLLHLAWNAFGETAEEASVLDGLPRSLAELASGADDTALRDSLSRTDEKIAAAVAAWPHASRVCEAAVDALAALRPALKLAGNSIKHRLLQKERQLARVLFEASGLVVRAAARPTLAAPGSNIAIDLHLDARDVLIDGPPQISVVIASGWRAEPSVLSGSGALRLQIPDDAPLGDGYADRFTPTGMNGAVGLLVSFSIKGVDIRHPIDLEEPLALAPAIDVVAHPDAVILNSALPATAIRFRISALATSPEVRGATIEPDIEPGWACEPQRLELDFAAGRTASDIAISGRGEAGLYTFPLKANGKPALTLRQSDYRHTGRVARSVPAAIRMRVLEAAIPTGVRIGYAGSGSDRVDHWLRQLGLDVVALDPATIAGGDLSKFDTILVGVFAFGMRPELAAAAARLHDFVRGGGNLVTLYHRPWDGWDPKQVPPAFLKIGQPSLRWRVTDENAAVKVLVPNHPLLNQPNHIAAGDWEGWHKERGLYFAAEWDSVYRPLLSMADPGEEPLQGALLSAEIGKGRHTHTSLVLHHQMEHLVPGAFRLMANLVTPRSVRSSR
jgi:LmbE family N-acetylglucosaminyl deacetylase